METAGYCNVCGGGGALEIVSSGIAPVSGNLCFNCRQKGAENLGVVMLWLATYGGPKCAPEFSKKLVSFNDGDYIGWERLQKYYQQHESEILETFNEEFTLE